MKNFTEVYKNSKHEVLAQRAALVEAQKVEVIKALKEMYMVTGKVTELPKKMQDEMTRRVLEYWNPKSGLTKAGQTLLTEKKIFINSRSTKEDIKLYIESQVRTHYNTIVEAYRNSNVDAVTEAFKCDLFEKTNRRITDKFIKETVWKLLESRFREGELFL